MPLKVTFQSRSYSNSKVLDMYAKIESHNMDHEMVYADRTAKDEQLLLRSFLWKTKIANVHGCWNLKFIFCFMETAH
jgi:hypothetical protein